MRRRIKRGDQPECVCEDIPVGTIFNYYDHRLNHLRGLVLGDLWLAIPYICPYTGIVWLSRYVEGRDWRIDDIVYERTRHRQPRLENYTVSEATLKIYHEKRQVEDIVPGRVGGVPLSMMDPEWPDLPIEGLLFGMFSLSENTRASWYYEEIMIEVIYGINLWVYLPAALGRGDSGRCWLASPFEPITQQVLRSGVVLEWSFAGQIGEMHVESQRKVPAAQFYERFGFDKPFRDIEEEFSKRFDEMGRRKRQR